MLAKMEQDLEEDEGDLFFLQLVESALGRRECLEDILVPASSPVACSNCNKCFSSEGDLKDHLTREHTMCDLCDTQCCSEENLRNHKEIECSMSRRQINIELIAKESAMLGRNLGDLRKYKFTEEEEENEEEEEQNGSLKVNKTSNVTEFNKCLEMGCEKIFRSVASLIEHQKRAHTSTGERSWFCGLGGCQKIFFDRSALNEHRYSKHPELEEFQPVDMGYEKSYQPFSCPVCCRGFKFKNTCSLHIKREHLGWTKSLNF